jgi:hypothetical protein
MRTPTCNNYTKTVQLLVYFFRGLINQLIIISAPTKFLCGVFLNFIKSFDLDNGESLIIIAKRLCTTVQLPRDKVIFNIVKPQTRD